MLKYKIMFAQQLNYVPFKKQAIICFYFLRSDRKKKFSSRPHFKKQEIFINNVTNYFLKNYACNSFKNQY